MMKIFTAAFVALVLAASGASAQTPGAPEARPLAAPTQTPPAGSSLVTPSPVVTSAAATPPTPVAAPSIVAPNLVSYTGQLLDVRNGYTYFTTGDAFPTIDAYRVIDYFTGQPTSVAPRAKMFARATFDPVTKKIIELAITTRRLQTSQGLGEASAYVALGSKTIDAPEIQGQALTGKQVAVVFEVTVPPTTAFTDNVYIATDVSQWNATAIKLDRVDAYKYRAQRFFASGTKFAYRVTRGTWNSVERGEDNLDTPPHQFFVREVDSLAARVTVYHWSDERGGTSRGAGPDSLPTPYNPSPFGGRILVPQIPVRATPHP